MQLDCLRSQGCSSSIGQGRNFGQGWPGGVMLLSNYGRDQVGDSGFDGSQAPLLHTVGGGVVQPSVTEVSSNSLADRSLKPPTPDQMLAAVCHQRPGQQERRLKPHSDQVLKCPRCESMNTKFCYYNNYSLTQPRHFCKNCKRYWTKGGALRNVPVGGGCRKNKRVKQRQQEHPPPSTTSDEIGPVGGTATPGPNTDGASSSSMLQPEFPTTSSAGAAGLYDQVAKASNGMSLPFDRVDAGGVSRIFPGAGNHTPISINWATGQMALGSHPQQFDPSMLGLNLPAATIKQEPGHPGDGGGDINCMFDPGSLGMGTHGAVNESLSSYVPVENFGLNGASVSGEMMWRFPQQPKLVSLLEDGSEQERGGSSRHHVLLDLEAGHGGEKMKHHHKSKASGDSLSSDYDQQGDSSSPDQWQPSSEGFFESGGETNYWNNGVWSSELTYGNHHHHHHHHHQAPGNHQLL